MKITTIHSLPVKKYFADLEVPRLIYAGVEDLEKLKQILLSDIDIIGRCIEVELEAKRSFHFYFEAQHSASVASRLSTLRKMWHMRPVIYPNQIKVGFRLITGQAHRRCSFYVENNIKQKYAESK